jgi:hypothetical protein
VRALTAAVLALALAVGACSFGDLQLRNDHRLRFEAPDARDNVELPLTVRWSMRDFRRVGLDGSQQNDSGTFAVFVDRAPMPVGKDLRWVARDIAGCASEPACPTTEQLADRDVLVTSDLQVTIERLPEASGRIGKEQHFVYVVLLDGTGRRIGESGWYLPFTTDRRSDG